MSTFDQLIADLTRDAYRVQPKDALQFCSNWFQQRLEEQRIRLRDAVSSNPRPTSLPQDHFRDAHGPREPEPAGGPLSTVTINGPLTPQVGPLSNGSPFSNVGTLSHPGPVSHGGPFSHGSPFSQGGPPIARRSFPPPSSPGPPLVSPFGTLNVPGNAAAHGPFQTIAEEDDLAPTAPISTSSALPSQPGDFLHPPVSALARRVSISAESIIPNSSSNKPLPVNPKTPQQVERIRKAIAKNFIFRDLDEDQEKTIINAMQEVKVGVNEAIIRQGDVGEYFYVVEEGLLHCYIQSEPLPPPSLATGAQHTPSGYHPTFGKKVAECKPGNSFGELALMYGHPRAATVLTIEPSTLWSLDRITFRTIILKAAHRRRTMYEHFLSTVPLLNSLSPEERSKIADALMSKVCADGETVVEQGEMGDTFFFIEEGEAIVTKRVQGDDGEWTEKQVGHLKKGDYFGELSLLRLSPRAATVRAINRTDPTQPKLKVAALGASAFTRLLGPMREIMERKAGEAYGLRASR